MNSAPPRQVLLFTGHMVDAPGRAVPRFPSALVPAAAAAIARTLDQLGAGPADLALTQGAAGGDLLFAEACLQRGLRIELLLPQPEPAFIAASILPSDGGAAWLQRWQALRLALPTEPQVLPDSAAANRYERCNQWLLDTALQHGADRLRFICLWDGAGADGPGGTGHLIQQVQARGAALHWIDIRCLHP